VAASYENEMQIFSKGARSKPLLHKYLKTLPLAKIMDVVNCWMGARVRKVHASGSMFSYDVARVDECS